MVLTTQHYTLLGSSKLGEMLDKAEREREFYADKKLIFGSFSPTNGDVIHGV